MSVLSVLLESFSWKVFVDFCRLSSLCTFLLCSLSLNWYSFASLICLLGSLYLLDREKYSEKSVSMQKEIDAFKVQRRVNDEENISKDLKKKFTERILDYVLYDVANNQTLRNFEPIKHNTHCTFARSAVLWGAPDYREDFSLENNVEKCIPALMKLLILGEALHLDGFVIQLPGDEFGHDVELFGQGVRRVLKFISDCDPSGYHCMNKSFVSQIGWSFEFDGFPIFVTTFAPCYPLNHSRYAFEAQHGFVLLQPMYSFKIHNIGSDTIHTNWDNPKTIRDKIRVAYKENGRPYHIRNTLYYPMAHDIVKPMEEGSDKLVEWWKDRNNTINDNNNTDESDIN